MHLLNTWSYQLQTLQLHRSHDVEDKALCDLDIGSGLNQVFLVNAFPPKLLDSFSSFKVCRCIGHMMKRILGNVSCLSMT